MSDSASERELEARLQLAVSMAFRREGLLYVYPHGEEMMAQMVALKAAYRMGKRDEQEKDHGSE